MSIKLGQVFSELNDIELISIYGLWLEELKARDLIRTNNVIGELGESLAIKFYNQSTKLPRLQAAPIGTQNIDAISIEGNRYSIKSTTGRVTGVFYGLAEPGTQEIETIKFEFVIIVVFTKEFKLKAIYEIAWSTFIKHRKWHSRMRAWNLSISNALLKDSKIVFQL